MQGQRKPTELHVLEGTYRKDHHGDPHSVPASGEPEPPTTLSAEERAYWDHIVPILLGMGVAKKADTDEIVKMCRWWVEWNKAMDHLSNMRASRKGYGTAVRTAAVASDAYDRVAKRFGLTPCDRAKIRTGVAQASKIRTRPREA